MPLLHDPTVRNSMRARVQALTPAATRKWGRMTVDQMLWHVNQALEQALGQVPSTPIKAPVPGPIWRFLVLNVPWPHGAATAPELRADLERRDFDAERERCLRLIDAFSTKRVEERWPVSSSLGQLSGRQWSRFAAKHLDHHLRQFSV